MKDNEERVEILIEALPYMRKYAGKTVVIKYGGSAMEDEQKKKEIIDDIVFLRQTGINVVLVHGGGKEINAMLTRVGIEPKFVNGLRYTDSDTMQIVQMVLCGKVNKELCAMFAARQVRALGLCGLDGALMKATRKTDEDLGYVGDVTAVNAPLLESLIAQDILPVISSVALASDGSSLNINADLAAAAIAVAVGAEKLLLLTDVAGVLRDKNDPSTLISTIKASEADALKSSGVITGGMLPKIDCCLLAVRNGVKAAAIVDGLMRHSILTHLFSETFTGTMIV